MAGMIIVNYTLKIHDNFWSHVKADSYYKGHPQGENVSQAPKGKLLEIENLPKVSSSNEYNMLQISH